MPDKIQLHNLSDRELLVLCASKMNEVLPDHEKRLRWLERLAYALVGAWGLLSTWLGIHVAGGK